MFTLLIALIFYLLGFPNIAGFLVFLVFLVSSVCGFIEAVSQTTRDK